MDCERDQGLDDGDVDDCGDEWEGFEGIEEDCGGGRISWA